MSSDLEKRFQSKLKLELLKLEDAELALSKNNAVQIKLQMDRLTTAINQLSIELDSVLEAMLNEEKTMVSIKACKDTHLIEINKFIEMTTILSGTLDDIAQAKLQQETARTNESLMARIKIEQELSEAREKLVDGGNTINPSSLKQSQSVRLQKYTITPFRGDFKDWLRFWNQFSVEINDSCIAEISKFNYLLELVKGKPRDDILGLPHTEEGYEEAKRILIETYGKDIKVQKAVIKEIESLHIISNRSDQSKVHDFYNKLSRCVRTLKTMNKIDSSQSLKYTLMDKLGPVREVLAQTDDDWEDWGLEEIVENLRKYVDRNPVTFESKQPDRESKGAKKDHRKKDDKLYSAMAKKDGSSSESKKGSKKACLYCEEDHQSSECTKLKTVAERKAVFMQKRLCFNCGGQHRASDCKSSRTCLNCKAKHHTSLCDRTNQDDELAPMLLTPKKGVIYPVAIARVNGQLCRIFLDTGTGGRYASSTLIQRAKAKYVGTVDKNVQMLLHSTSQSFEQYEVTVSNFKEDFEMKVCVTKVDKPDILKLENPNYKDVIERHQHLAGVTMLEKSDKDYLPVHLILGSGDFAKLKTATAPKIGKTLEDPVAELTKLGWVIYSPGDEDETSHLNLIKSASEDYNELVSLDVLGIKDESTDQSNIYDEFEEQLERQSDGSYQTGLLWKPVHPDLLTNEARSKARLANSLKKLNRDPEKLQVYDDIIKTQLQEGIVEEVVPSMITDEKKQFFIPHKMVVKEEAETTKNRIVYDASARAVDHSPSLNECLEVGPPLQNRIWDILVRNRFKPIVITGDLKQAFLQVRIRESDRNYLQFHWIKDTYTQEMQVLRFTRALFGLVQSPFLLGGTIKHHLQQYKEHFQKIVSDIEKELYVDDLIHGVNHVQEGQQFKDQSTKIFKDANFTLHKWHSNIPSLEGDCGVPKPSQDCADKPMQENDESTYAKQQFKTDGSNETRLLGIAWDKTNDTLIIKIPVLETAATKRGMLKYLASIYDPLGFLSPITLQGKLIFRDVCDEKYSWDKPLEGQILQRWMNFKFRLPMEVTIPRSVVTQTGKVDSVDLHTFCDASKNGISATIYAVTRQGSHQRQGLVAAKSRLAKKTTIPRLELTACHMGAKLLTNVCKTLEDLKISKMVVWSDSTVALHWINGNGDLYKQFVRNQIRKIVSMKVETWRHVPGLMNPADVGSRGAAYDELDDLWWKGPEWLSDESKWPENIKTCPSEDTDSELKKTQEILSMTATDKQSLFQNLIEKMSFKKSIRVVAWIARFKHNCLHKKAKKCGPLTTEEWNSVKMSWIRNVQQEHRESTLFKKHENQFNLIETGDGIYRCHGRIQGDKPIYLPKDSLFTQKLVMHAHLCTLHGGVGLTMTYIRENYWIPCLRQLTKKVRSSCYGCKRHQVRALFKVNPAPLPTDRTTGWRSFQVIGLDYAGPFTFKKTANTTGKAYILLFACSLTRAVCLELVKTQSLNEFLPSLKRLIGRRGRPEKIYSDNFSTFVAAAKWLKKAVMTEETHDFMSNQNITWKFNMSRAPWWGGQFERMVGLVKSVLYKSLGKALLTWDEFVEVLLDTEIVLNNRPLSYVEDDEEMPILTPNVMSFGQPNHIPEGDVTEIEEHDLRKRAKYLKKCKDQVWRRWREEYLRGLRERHNLTHNQKENKLNVGDVMIIKGDEKNRSKWKIGIVTDLIIGRDGLVRGARLRAGRDHLERAVEHLYPMELSCDEVVPEVAEEAPATRPKRNAAVAARSKIKCAFDDHVEVE